MTAICAWCSAEITDEATECPSCGANLVPDGDPNVPGVTAVDAASIIRSKAVSEPRSRLLSWISGEYPTDAPTQSEHQAIAPPDMEVRREILRLELEAEVANLQAEADALRAEAALEGRVLDFPEDAVVAGSESPEGEATDVTDEATDVTDAAPTDAADAAPAEAADSAPAGTLPTDESAGDATAPTRTDSEDKATA